MASSAAPQLDERIDTGPAADDADSEAPYEGSRLGRVAVSLLQVHAQIAQQELERDQGRIVAGVVLLLIGALLLATVIVLLQVLGLALLQASGLRFASAVLAMAAMDAALGGLLVLLGSRALRKPVMPQTRSLLRRTLGALISS